MRTRKDIELKEKALARYAQKSALSKGRLFKEKEHAYRSCYQRDKDRIIHSTAFRRLEYKTQVFVNHEGDYYRTRLTHTLEVNQIAKTIARALGLNEDLVEAISLAHDLGHTPFGHSGEDALREIMNEHGGFDHNSHGLRVVDHLEQRYPGFPGLNLTFETREGIIKHSTPYDRPAEAAEFKNGESPILEIQVVDIADEIAYDNHDLDDGLTSGLIREADMGTLETWSRKDRVVRKTYPRINDDVRKYQIIRSLIDEQVADVLRQSESNIKRCGVGSAGDAVKLRERIITSSESMQRTRNSVRAFLTDKLYRHYRVVRMSTKARRFLESIFKAYLDNADQLPPATQSRLFREDRYRVICDYIAGMTDRYALDEYKKFFEPYERV